MESEHFGDRLAERVKQRGNPVLVGLDPRWRQLPSGVRGNDESPSGQASAYEAFCQGVIDVVAPLVAAVKPQMAFFEQLGPPGLTALESVVRYARSHGLLVILDGKRNDIGSTATAYAGGLLGSESGFGGDALTVSPYLGDDSLTPFVERASATGSGVFVLVKTSNPGGGMFQDLIADGQPVYRHVADYVEQLASQSLGEANYGCVGAVVGATYPEQLAELRAAMPHSWLLVPGFGAQGGAAADVAHAFDEEGLGAIINSSRAIIFAHARPEFAHYGETKWQDAVDAATNEMAEQLRTAIH